MKNSIIFASAVTLIMVLMFGTLGGAAALAANGHFVLAGILFTGGIFTTVLIGETLVEKTAL